MKLYDLLKACISKFLEHLIKNLYLLKNYLLVFQAKAPGKHHTLRLKLDCLGSLV